MKINQPSDYIIINGTKIPVPHDGIEIISSTVVDAGRNANGTVVGQIIGRKLWKLNNLEWIGLTQEQWSKIKSAIAPFYVKVRFMGDDASYHTITMYPSDITARPLFLNDDMTVRQYRSCKFNLIDCGKTGES